MLKGGCKDETNINCMFVRFDAVPCSICLR